MPHFFLAASAVIVLTGCAAPVDQSVDPQDPVLIAAELQDTSSEGPTLIQEEKMMPPSPPEPEQKKPEPEQYTSRQTPTGVAGLPGARGQVFQNLDEYLAHLEEGGKIDRPFWELMEDGRYRWNTGRAKQFQEPKYATRAELLAEYGFDE